MKRYMLDTNIVSLLIRRQSTLVERVQDHSMSSLCVSAITAGELAFGLARRPEATRLRSAVDEFLLRVDVLPWDGAIADVYGALRARMEIAGKNLAQLLPQARSWPRPRRLTLTLLGREDSAQHFGISAALAIWAGEPAAKAIGMYKEIDDSRGGSGFSFADLAADRAGTRFGELLVESSAHLHAALRGTLSDADLLASPAGLPESLSEADFRRRFGDGDNLAYRELASEIERRLTALPLYR